MWKEREKGAADKQFAVFPEEVFSSCSSLLFFLPILRANRPETAVSLEALSAGGRKLLESDICSESSFAASSAFPSFFFSSSSRNADTLEDVHAFVLLDEEDSTSSRVGKKGRVRGKRSKENLDVMERLVEKKEGNSRGGRGGRRGRLGLLSSSFFSVFFFFFFLLSGGLFEFNSTSEGGRFCPSRSSSFAILRAAAWHDEVRSFFS